MLSRPADGVPILQLYFLSPRQISLREHVHRNSGLQMFFTSNRLFRTDSSPTCYGELAPFCYHPREHWNHNRLRWCGMAGLRSSFSLVPAPDLHECNDDRPTSIESQQHKGFVLGRHGTLPQDIFFVLTRANTEYEIPPEARADITRWVCGISASQSILHGLGIQ
ncbi:hypothetical protein AVEN_202861-1 [Araneus ventricosus]|uniref:Uncharacterized protein n=1 Tax=Araneus ventricosus TaxID=182803 RepID=A0A4Y2WRL6_ARAVE|nr:hypothetical protein AVEN_202861-1 [Araneus ventricosus]